MVKTVDNWFETRRENCRLLLETTDLKKRCASWIELFETNPLLVTGEEGKERSGSHRIQRISSIDAAMRRPREMLKSSIPREDGSAFKKVVERNERRRV